MEIGAEISTKFGVEISEEINPEISGKIGDEVPTFEWVKYDHDNAELKITYPDGQDSDFALLSKTKNFISTVDNKDCLFSGNLVKEPDIPVSVTHICDDKDNFEISVNSRQLTHYMFKVTNGKVEALTSTLLESDTSTFVSKEAQQLGDGISLKKLPKEGFLLRLKLFYDQSFREAFGTRAESVLNRVVSHAQTIYYWPSLMTKVKLEVVEIEGIDTRYSSSGDNLDFLGATYSVKSSSSINANIYFCVESGGGQVGIANVGAVCLRKLNLRSAIVEHNGHSDAASAETLAHEIGHLLGMDHDFISKNNQHYQRYDSLHRKCKGIESIMDYVDNSKQWSTCSVEDFAKYYSNHKSFCLPLLSQSISQSRIKLDGVWGDWSADSVCPKNGFVIEFQTRNEPPQGDGDDTAMNAIKFKCNDKSVVGFDGIWGDWNDFTYCKGGYTKAQIKSESTQGDGDDTAMTGIKLFCSTTNSWHEGSSNEWGSWSDVASCPAGMKIVGASIKVEKKQGSGDDTAMNGIEIICN